MKIHQLNAHLQFHYKMPALVQKQQGRLWLEFQLQHISPRNGSESQRLKLGQSAGRDCHRGSLKSSADGAVAAIHLHAPCWSPQHCVQTLPIWPFRWPSESCHKSRSPSDRQDVCMVPSLLLPKPCMGPYGLSWLGTAPVLNCKLLWMRADVDGMACRLHTSKAWQHMYPPA